MKSVCYAKRVEAEMKVSKRHRYEMIQYHGQLTVCSLTRPNAALVLAVAFVIMSVNLNSARNRLILRLEPLY